MTTFLKQAFELQIPDATPAEGAYVALMESVPFYGGPEEGGWWGRDTVVAAYRYYATKEAANAAYNAVQQTAKELSERSRRDHGDQCNRELDWLDARGLDADFLPEPDGPSEFFVTVSDTPPEDSRGSRRWD